MHKIFFLMSIIPSCMIGMGTDEVIKELKANYVRFCTHAGSVHHNSCFDLDATMKGIIQLQESHPNIPQSFYTKLYEEYDLTLCSRAIAASKVAKRIAYSQIDASIAHLPHKPDLYNFEPDDTIVRAVDYLTIFEKKIITANRLREILRKKAGL